MIVDSPYRSRVRAVLRRMGISLERPSEWQRRATRDAKSMQELVRETLTPTSIGVDVGAHTGTILRLIVEAAPTRRHHAFEPLPDLAARLQSYYPSVAVHQCALADQTGEAQFFRVINAPGWSGLRRQKARADSLTEAITVQVRRLDDVLGSDRVDFIKIDVEGAELGVLKGARETLNANHPVLVFEHAAIHAEEYGTTADTIYDEVTSHGYSISPLGSREALSRSRFVQLCARAATSNYDRHAHTNWVAFPPA